MMNTTALMGGLPQRLQNLASVSQTPRFGTTPSPAPEQVKAWLEQVKNSGKMDALIRMNAEEGPYPMPMLMRLSNPATAREMARQERLLDQAGFERMTRMGSIQSGRATSLETLAQLSEMDFVVSTELSR